MANNREQQPQAPIHCAVRLFVAGDAPNSRIARENLTRFQETLPNHAVSVEIVDVNERPEAALEEGVFITPALKVMEPAPGGTVYGNLSDLDVLRRLFVFE